jgi:hypothetical protein
MSKQDREIRQGAKSLAASINKIATDAQDDTAINPGLIPSGFTTGNPTFQPAEASAAGTKVFPVLEPFSVFGPPIASQRTLSLVDGEGNRHVIGREVDLSSAYGYAGSWAGLKWVQPGASVDTRYNASVERSTNSATYVTAKRWKVDRPGKYRVNYSVSRNGGTGNSKLQIELTDGTKVDCGTGTAYSGTAYPTFGTQSIDMTIALMPSEFLILAYANDGANLVYVKDATISYADATTAQALHAAVLTD